MLRFPFKAHSNPDIPHYGLVPSPPSYTARNRLGTKLDKHAHYFMYGLLTKRACTAEVMFTLVTLAVSAVKVLHFATMR